MSHYVGLMNFTDRGIANVKDSPARLEKPVPCCARWAASSGRST
ncbi:MAG TPA: hypothetical protein VFY87_28505 [Geminicoccaceae bacterium]|nr:hypothetical protein [Geminicoccaceae bacterium]